jgi:hypothetical protein
MAGLKVQKSILSRKTHFDIFEIVRTLCGAGGGGGRILLTWGEWFSLFKPIQGPLADGDYIYIPQEFLCSSLL